MNERTGIITFQGASLTLLGDGVTVGALAPDFTAVDRTMREVHFADLKGQLLIISAVPSLDTPVCELQTKRFNQEASRVAGKIITISMDLPFAQERFCGAHGIENLIVLSDYRERAFGRAYGLLIKELQLLARAVLIIDAPGNVVYSQVVPEISHEPNYEEIHAVLARQ